MKIMTSIMTMYC